MIWTGFLLGLFGSLHCLVMCGPIALSIPVPKENYRIPGILLYNIGRSITYGVFGFAFGLIGNLFVWYGYQQALSIVAGVSLILLALFKLYGVQIIGLNNFLFAKFQKIKLLFNFLMSKRSMSSLFYIGIINGLLPCGLVYMALIGAVAMGDIAKGTIYMIMFGIGTIPMMFIVSYSGSYFRFSWRQKVLRIIPYAVVVLGVLLVVRGLNLGVSYISPEFDSNASVSCCHPSSHIYPQKCDEK